MSRYIIFALMIGCSSCASKQKPYKSVGQTYVSVGVRRMVKSAVRVRIYCEDKLYSYGSGTVISDRHVLTARHVVRACNGKRTMLTVQLDDGRIAEVIAIREAKNVEVDTALMVLVGNEPPFKRWAKIAWYQPDVGQRVWLYAGDGGLDVVGEWGFQIKQGWVSQALDGALVVSAHGVPGNSGCGVFDEQGELLAVLWGGSWNASREFYFEAYRPTAWSDLIP